MQLKNTRQQLEFKIEKRKKKKEDEGIGNLP